MRPVYLLVTGDPDATSIEPFRDPEDALNRMMTLLDAFSPYTDDIFEIDVADPDDRQYDNAELYYDGFPWLMFHKALRDVERQARTLGFTITHRYGYHIWTVKARVHAVITATRDGTEVLSHIYRLRDNPHQFLTDVMDEWNWILENE